MLWSIKLTDYFLNSRISAVVERKGVTVRAGLNIALDIDLAVGNVSQTVEVTAGDVPLLETVSTEQAVNISGEMVRGLPLTGRREWSDTLQLTPGILSARPPMIRWFTPFQVSEGEVTAGTASAIGAGVRSHWRMVSIRKADTTPAGVVYRLDGHTVTFQLTKVTTPVPMSYMAPTILRDPFFSRSARMLLCCRMTSVARTTLVRATASTYASFLLDFWPV